MTFCIHCGLTIRYVEAQGWVHCGSRGTFGCRDRYGLTIDNQYAAPPTGTPTPGVRPPRGPSYQTPTQTPGVAPLPPEHGATPGRHLPAPQKSSPNQQDPAPTFGAGTPGLIPARPRLPSPYPVVAATVPAALVNGIRLPGRGDAV